jgi:hypothetical protein
MPSASESPIAKLLATRWRIRQPCRRVPVPGRQCLSRSCGDFCCSETDLITKIAWGSLLVRLATVSGLPNDLN